MNKIFAFIILATIFVVACTTPTPDRVVPTLTPSPTSTKEAYSETGGGPGTAGIVDAIREAVETREAESTEVVEERYTAVLLGEDHTGTGSGPRTDTFIILTYSPQWNDLLIISIPRDLYVEYGGQASIFCNPPTERDRINRAYSLGGFDCVRSVVEHNFGLVIDTGVAVVDFDGFIELVNGMSGLMIHPDWLPEPIHMNGEHLLTYVRERTASGAINRDRRTVEVILAMKEQWLDAHPFETILTVTSFAFERVKTDIPFAEAVELIKAAKDNYSEDWNVRRVIFLPNREVAFHSTEGGASVLIPLVDLRGWMECLLSGHGSEACSWLHSLTDS